MVKKQRSSFERRKKAVRIKIKASSLKLRLSVFRSNRYIYAQIIDDAKRKTLIAVSELDLESWKSKKKTKNAGDLTGSADKEPSRIERARRVGQILAQRALKEGIKKVVFDRGPYKYHGRVKALAESTKKTGLIF